MEYAINIETCDLQTHALGRIEAPNYGDVLVRAGEIVRAKKNDLKLSGADRVVLVGPDGARYEVAAKEFL